MQEIEESLDETSELDNSEIFKFEKVSQISLTFFDFFLKGIELPGLFFILSKLLVFDLVESSFCFGWYFDAFFEMLYNFLCIFTLTFPDVDLVVDIFVQQFFLFLLPTVPEMFDQLQQHLSLLG